ncbi:MAG: hypothetical protein ACU837_02225 [Gammaproteobacteria bacterium]
MKIHANSKHRIAAFFVVVFCSGATGADWSLTGRGTLFYTDDVGIFSATRRLTRDGDPTQPALDSRLIGQGSDGVFEPMIKLSKSFSTAYGTTSFDLRGDSFIYFDHTRYNHGTMVMQGQQAFTQKTELLLRYYYGPDMFLGDNEEHRSGTFMLVPERVSSYIWSMRFDTGLPKKPGFTRASSTRGARKVSSSKQLKTPMSLSACKASFDLCRTAAVKAICRPHERSGFLQFNHK